MHQSVPDSPSFNYQRSPRGIASLSKTDTQAQRTYMNIAPYDADAGSVHPWGKADKKVSIIVPPGYGNVGNVRAILGISL